jgi:pyruvate kinase
LAVEETRGEKVVCRVEAGGTLTSNKGMNLPGVPLRVPTVTSKDLEDLAFGLRQGVDFVAVSFVRLGAEIAALKRRLARAGADTPVIAKIEKPEAIADLDAILEAADGLMVARGDLGVEFPPEKVPLLQKEIIARANAARKPVITATQMLESMISSHRPTRAEASDVANAVFDGTDAVMLSGETAAGKYPVEAVQVMDRIVREAETGLLSRRREERSEAGGTLSAAEAVTTAAARIARQSGARAIVGFSQSGLTGRLVASSRPEIPAYVFTPRAETWFRMTLCRGVVPLRLSFMANTDRLIDSAIRGLRKAGRVRKGDRLVFIMGAPPSRRGTTNLLKLHEV